MTTIFVLQYQNLRVDFNITIQNWASGSQKVQQQSPPQNPEQHQPPGAKADRNAQSPACAPVANLVQPKRTFSSLWNRKKSSGALSVNNAATWPMALLMNLTSVGMEDFTLSYPLGQSVASQQRC